MYIAVTVIGIIAVFLLVIIFRTLAFVPSKEDKIEFDEEAFDKNAAIFALGELVKCKTVSRYSHDEEDEVEFEKSLGVF